MVDDSQAILTVSTVQQILAPLLTAACAFALISLIALPAAVQSFSISAGVAALLASCQMIAHRGHPRAAIIAIIVVLFAVATLDILLGGGISAPGHSIFLLTILMTSFLVSARAGIAVAALSLGVSGVVGAMELGGVLPEPIFGRDAMTYWWSQVAVIVATSGVVWVALQRLRRGDERSRESERLQRLVADNASDFIWSLAPDGTVTYASPAVESMLGFTPKEMLAGEITENLSDEKPSELFDRARDALAEGKRTLQFDAQYRRKDGSLLWCEVRATPLLDTDGRLTAMTGVTRDISERKLAESRHELLEERLRQAQKMEAVGRLAGGIAHDFNNYLTVILGNAESLAAESKGKESAALEEITGAAERSAALTHQLLAFSRKQVLQPVVLDLNQTLRSTGRLLGRVLGEDIKLDMSLSRDLGRIRADPSQLEQVCLNLAVNARAAMPAGGRLSLETRNVYLDEEHADRHLDVSGGRYALLIVSDTGVGMSEETRQHIFEPFFTTDKNAGTGLGLATVHGIVTQSGGAIRTESELGRGTTFRIYLPCVDEPTDAVVTATLAVPVEESRRVATILVVEDQEMVLRLTRSVLEQDGHRVYVASDGQEAFEIAERLGGAIDLLLTDVVLPGIDGVDIAKELERRFGIAVLYMSGFTADRLSHRGVFEPGVEILHKPFRAKELRARVRTIIDG